MPGDPQPQTKFAQENAPGVAEDMSAIMEVGVPVSVAAGDFADTVHVIDWNPGEGESAADAEDKYFATGIGQVVDDILELVDWSLPE